MRRYVAFTLALLFYASILPWAGATDFWNFNVNKLTLDNNATTVYGDGTSETMLSRPWVDVRAYSTLAAAVAAIGSTDNTLLISQSCASDNLTIPSNVTLVFTKAGRISPNSGNTVKILGAVDAAPTQQIFSGAGTISFGGGTASFSTLREVYPEWWGCVGNASTTPQYTANTAAIQAAIESVRTDSNGNLGGLVQLNSTNYDFNDTIHMRRGVTLAGRSWSGTTLRYNGSGTAIDIVPDPTIDTTGWITRVTLRDFWLRAVDNTASIGIYAENLIRGTFKDIHVWGKIYGSPDSRSFTTAGIKIHTTESTYNLRFDEVYATYCSGDGLRFSGSSASTNGSMINIIGGDYSWNGQSGIRGTNADWSINIKGAYLSANDNNELKIGRYTGGEITGNVFESDTSTLSQIKMCFEGYACKGLMFSGNTTWGSNNTMGPHLDLSPDGLVGGTISNNYLGAKGLYAVRLGQSMNVQLTGNWLGNRTDVDPTGVPTVTLLDNNAGYGVNNIFYSTIANTQDSTQASKYIWKGNNVRLGIGTETPTNRLEVTGSGNGLVVVTDNTSYAIGVGGSVDLRGNADANGSFTTFGRIKAGKVNATDGHHHSYMGFHTVSEVDESFPEWMRLTSGGDLQFNTAAKGVVLKNAAGTVTKRVRLNDAGDGLIFEAP